MYADNLGSIFGKGFGKKIGKTLRKVGKGAMSLIVPPGGGLVEPTYVPPPPARSYVWAYVLGGVAILTIGAIIYKSRKT